MVMHPSSVPTAASAPILPSPQIEPACTRSREALTCCSLLSILLVEDEPVVSAFLECALKHLGFQVTACSDVDTALQSFQKHAPTLILTDCNLPQRSGVELIEIVTSKSEITPIIGMSAQHYNGVKMIDSGATAFIPKPIEMDTLKRIVVQIADCGIASRNARLSSAAISP